MAEAFDPYYQWLGIPPKFQPPNHYRLLALEDFESNPDVIESAADRQIAHVRLFQNGPPGTYRGNELPRPAVQKASRRLTPLGACTLPAALVD